MNEHSEALAKYHSPHLWNGKYQESLREGFKTLSDEEIEGTTEYHQTARIKDANEWLNAMAGLYFPSSMDDLAKFITFAPDGSVLEDRDGDKWMCYQESLIPMDSDIKSPIQILPAKMLRWGDKKSDK